MADRGSAILFDLDETLMVEYDSVDQAFRATCERAKVRCGLDAEKLYTSIRERAREIWYSSPLKGFCQTLGFSSAEGLWGSFNGPVDPLPRFYEWIPAYRRQAWTAALADLGIDDPQLVRFLIDTFPRERSRRHVVFPDSVPTLNRLAQRHRLALITNGIPELQNEKLDRGRLTPYFDPILISGGLGIAKPDPRIFQIALEKLRVQPDRAVMVGDNLNRDVQGARRAGLKAVWINRSGADLPPDIQPDATIQTLDDLPALTRKWLE